jgi:hypothetical protein
MIFQPRASSASQLLGTVLISLGTAVFAGATSMVIDGYVKGGSLRGGYLVVFFVAGVVLSGGGAWLVATIRTGVGIAIAATDGAGFVDRYQDEAESFAQFGSSVFAAQSSLQVLETAADLRHLRDRLFAGIRTLTQVEHGARSVGVLFQGRLEVGFHLGSWLNVSGRRVNVYADIPDGTSTPYLRAVRLGAALETAPRVAVPQVPGVDISRARPVLA